MAKIGIVDSGVGGLSVFREIKKLLPDENYIYFADNANCPYGEKSREFIRERAFEITDMMLEKGVQIMVIACNTATAAAISELREKYDIPFIGMEPAVKPAALGTKTGVIGVLATAGTLKGSKYLQTKEKWEDNVRIEEEVGQGFVELVEKGKLEGPDVDETVCRSLKPLLDKGADTIVLGCTHYPFLIKALKKCADNLGYSNVNFIDPAPAVARRLLDVMSEQKISTGSEFSVELISSGSNIVLENLYSSNI